jgi:TDG/mug DNA glycosylase family protein
MDTDLQILPDIFPPGLEAVICGTAAGKKSAEAGAYYADPSNSFWTVLHQVRLTPRRLSPTEFSVLPQFGLGLTDLAKLESGVDATLSSGSFHVSTFEERVRSLRPRIVAFNGKTAGRKYLGLSPRTPLEYGLQSSRSNSQLTFVLPSTSGSARRYWDIEIWREFARLVHAK